MMRKIKYSDDIIKEELLYDFFNMSGVDLSKHYLNYLELPKETTIKITKIGVINWDFLEKKHKGKLIYGVFRKIDPLNFPKCEDPKLDYEDLEQISPVYIADENGNKYKTPQMYWFPLTDLIDGILKQQMYTKRKVFPVEIFIDKNPNKWMASLFKLVNPEYMKK